MKEVVLPMEMVAVLEKIYQELESEYSRVAGELNFSCTGCPDNCCDSYFLHHTYLEWAFLWSGFKQLKTEKQTELIERCQQYIVRCEKMRREGNRPQVMCPLNEDGRCILYNHRLLVCRTHGVPATMTRPDGQILRFPGCFRCQDIVDSRSEDKDPPSVERTPSLRKIVELEDELLDHKRHLAPKVKLTIAQMLVKGAPSLPLPHCERSKG
jgi:hypothetical protein